MHAFSRAERLRPERFDEVGFATDVAIEDGYALADAMRGVGIAAARAHETEMPRNIEGEPVFLIGVAAIGDFYIVHKLKEGMLGRGY